MILKQIDDKGPVIAELESLLEAAPKEVRPKIENDMRLLKAGIKGERESEYLIDFDFRNRKNSVVIHDLRLEYRGRVAQIDHLILTRFLDCYVLETKHFSTGMKITDDGDFLRWNNFKKTYEGMASPLAQNNRHIAVLRDVFGEICTPTRLGISLSPTFHSLILVSPQARIDRSKRCDTSAIIKADALAKRFEDDIDSIGVFAAVRSISKIVSREALQMIGSQLVERHKPVTIDYAKKYGIVAPSAHQQPTSAPDDSEFAAVTVSGNGNTPRCRACGRDSLAIQYGQYGYYFKCATCDGNTPIKVFCGHPGHKERIRKEGLRFFRECAQCGSSSLYFTNPA